MATRYAVANGNWSAVATWDGGLTIPGIGDDVYANGYTVTIDIDIACIKISTQLCPATSIAGGRFACTTNRILTCKIVAGTTQCFVPTGTSLTHIINGSVTGGTAANAYGIGYNAYTYGIFYINGNVNGGTVSSAYGIMTQTSIQYMEVNGDVIGNTASAIIGTLCDGMTINGNVYCNGTPYAILARIKTSCVARINGTITAGFAGRAIYAENSGTLVINGQEVSTNGWPAVVVAPTVRVVYDNAYASTMIQQHEDGSNFAMYTSTSVGHALTTDVRNGTVYGLGTLIGSAHIPPAAATGIGVPVDNTVGTAPLTTADLQNAILGKIVDGTFTVEDIIKILAAYAAGKTQIVDLGAGLATVTFRNLADTINKIVGDMNGSKRTNVTITP